MIKYFVDEKGDPDNKCMYSTIEDARERLTDIRSYFHAIDVGLKIWSIEIKEVS